MADSERHDSEDDDVQNIPGAVSVSKPDVDYNAPPPNVVYFLRQYLNVLFGTLLYEIVYGDEQPAVVYPPVGVFDEEGPLRAIPNLVSALLEYNNVYFERVDMIQSQDLYIPEPIWYTINLRDNSLRLHLNRTLYKRYCSRAPRDRPVTTIPCRIALDELNPSRPTEELPQIDRAVVFCAVLCDHVVQHVLSYIHELTKSGGSTKRVACESELMLHHSYANIGRGTTLHSMFNITAIGCQPAKPTSSSVNVTLLNSHSNNVQPEDSGLIDRIFNRQL